MNIESLQNSHVKEWCKLKEKKYRDETGLFLIEGNHLIEEAKEKNCIKEIISIDKTKKADFYVTKEIMKKISNQVSISDTIAVCYKLKEEEVKKKVLLLDGVQDPGNVGTIIRSAVAFSFDTILVSEDTVDIYNDKVIRASEGMLFKINIVRQNKKEALEKLVKTHQILITNVKEGKQIKEVPLKEKIVLVIGNEGNGVSEEVKKYKTDFIRIKIDKNCESLNAGVAAGILMYEIGVDNNE